jgi:phosphate transport system protein
MVDHTVKAYDKELDALGRRIAEMGGIAEKMVIDAMDALSNADTVLAHQVVATDLRVDALQREIEDMAVMTIVRRQPVSVDLRELISAIRIAGDLERMAILRRISTSAR